MSAFLEIDEDYLKIVTKDINFNLYNNISNKYLGYTVYEPTQLSQPSSTQLFDFVTI